MTYLLDVSTLVAWLWEKHQFHRRVVQWQAGVSVAVCPITEIGFLRVSCQLPFHATVADARKMLGIWRTKNNPLEIWCDMATLEAETPATGAKITDFYLASLAERHGLLLATLDQRIDHPSAFLVPL
jgi:predicted nucleic acid-binding protein